MHKIPVSRLMDNFDAAGHYFSQYRKNITRFSVLNCERSAMILSAAKWNCGILRISTCLGYPPLSNIYFLTNDQTLLFHLNHINYEKVRLLINSWIDFFVQLTCLYAVFWSLKRENLLLWRRPPPPPSPLIIPFLPSPEIMKIKYYGRMNFILFNIQSPKFKNRFSFWFMFCRETRRILHWD